MVCLKLVFVFSCFCLLAGFSEVKAASKTAKREVETPQENNQLEKVQQQLMTAFDSFKKSMEELTSKLNTQDIIQGVQNFTSKLEDYAKQAADQFASTASGSPGVETKKEETS